MKEKLSTIIEQPQSTFEGMNMPGKSVVNRLIGGFKKLFLLAVGSQMVNACVFPGDFDYDHDVYDAYDGTEAEVDASLDTEADTLMADGTDSADGVADSTQDEMSADTSVDADVSEMEDAVDMIDMVDSEMVDATDMVDMMCVAGFEDCDGLNGDCEVNTMTDVNNCGECGNSCDLSNVAVASCENGGCKIEECDMDFYDCNGLASDGCEVAVADFMTDAENCGGCGMDCTAGSCNAGLCNCGGGDTLLMNDDNNCGGCGNVCDVPNATASDCSMGECAPQGCESGFEDCDGEGPNGCEAGLSTDPNCNGCGNQCGAGEVCGGFQVGCVNQ